MRKLLTLLILSFLLVSNNVNADSNPKREMRAAWLATVYQLDWPKSATATEATKKSELTSILDKLQAANFNAVCLQVRPMADAFYKSSLEPSSKYITGTRGGTLSWDPLSYFVTECHKRNMEAHVWINPMRLPETLSTSITFDKKVTSKGWDLYYNSKRVLNPGIKAVRSHIASVVKEITRNYDIDGVIFDDYFYPEGIPNSADKTHYDSYVTTQKNNNATVLAQADWRRRNVNLMIRQVHDSIKAYKPYVRFGVGPAGVAGKKASEYGLPNCYAGSDWVYDGIYCDPLAWLKAKKIDYISPQIYWAQNHSTNPYEPIVKWWSEVAKFFGRHFFSSQYASNMTASELKEQIDINRNQNLTSEPGSIFYNTTGTLSKISAPTAKFKYPAALPEMTWYSNTKAPGTISSFTNKSNVLTATKISNTRYIFYAIPLDEGLKTALSTEHSGLKPKYILAISYSNTFTIPTDKRSGYWYAVALLDRYGKEWDLKTLNEPASDPAPVPTLTYPANGFKFEDSDITLAVAPNGSSTYTLQVSTTSTFTKTEYTSTDYIVDTDGVYQFVFPSSILGGEGKYYWRVMVTKTGYLNSYSEVRNFSIAPKVVDSSYSIITDGVNYGFTDPTGDKSNIRLTNAWIRSSLHGNAPGFHIADAATNYHRDMAVSVKDGIIYVLQAVTGSKTEPVYLQRFNAYNGMKLESLRLTLSAPYLAACYSPVNSVMTDSKGNVLVTGMKLAGSTSLILGKVNTSTGEVTDVATLSGASERIDHTGVYGEVDGTLYVFAAGASSKVMHRWTVSGGNAVHESFQISAATGIAPVVYPVSDSQFFMDSQNNAFELYKWGTPAVAAGFSSATALKPDVICSGGVYFTYEGVPFICYANDTPANGAKFALSHGKSLPVSYSGLNRLWTFPETTGGLGTFSTTNDQIMPVAYLPPTEVGTMASTSAPGYIVVMTPMNGLAAYKIDKVIPTGVIVPEQDIVSAISVGTDLITLPVKAETITIFNMSGRAVATAVNCSEIKRPALSGPYILVAETASGTVRLKLIL